MPGYGLTIPFDGPLHAQGDIIAALPELGYTDVWSAETDAIDAFTPLVLASVWAPTLRLGTAIVPAFTRGPATIAISAAALADSAPGRVLLGIGSSSNVIVEGWNGIAFDEPYKRTRDVLRFLRQVFAGEKVTEQYDTFSIRGFRLSRQPEQPPALLVAALREGMLRLAGREADGVILNWLSADDVKTVVPVVREAAGGADREVAVRLFVAPTEDADAVRAGMRRMIAAYLNVPVYAAFHEWLGRGEVLGPMWSAWKAGDRATAVEAIPDSLVDQLVIHGSFTECRAHVQRYLDAGATTVTLALIPIGIDTGDAIRGLAPAS